AVAGLVTGSLSTVIWSEITVLDELISVRFVSFVLAFLAVWLVSIATKEQAGDVNLQKVYGSEK
ncbi:MAG: hypothetical protein WDZ47_02045, partial [Bacteroidales bacterium]